MERGGCWQRVLWEQIKTLGCHGREGDGKGTGMEQEDMQEEWQWKRSGLKWQW